MCLTTCKSVPYPLLYRLRCGCVASDNFFSENFFFPNFARMADFCGLDVYFR